MHSRSQAPASGQQRRTRAALLAAAAELLRAGGLPSVAEVAQSADVSRRTAYRYFPTQEQLLTEAALETLRPGIESSFTAILDDPQARVEAAVRAMQKQTELNESLLRTMIRLTVERRPVTTPASADTKPAMRGSRRVEWIENALAPVRPKLSAADFARLTSAISLCVGAEALIVLRDIRGLSAAGAADVCAWAAKTLLRATLEDAKPAAIRTRRPP